MTIVLPGMSAAQKLWDEYAEFQQAADDAFTEGDENMREDWQNKADHAFARYQGFFGYTDEH